MSCWETKEEDSRERADWFEETSAHTETLMWRIISIRRCCAIVLTLELLSNGALDLVQSPRLERGTPLVCATVNRLPAPSQEIDNDVPIYSSLLTLLMGVESCPSLGSQHGLLSLANTECRKCYTASLPQSL